MRARRLIICCLIILINNFSRSAIPAQGQHEPIESLVTVQSRREEVSKLIAERERLRNSGDPVSFVKVSNRIVELHLKLSEPDSALADAIESLQVARQFAGSGNATILADTLIVSGRVYIRRNEYQAALHQLDEALQLSRDLSYSDGEAHSLAQIGVVKFEQSKHAEAEQKTEQALQIWREHPNKRGEAQALTTQGEIYIVLDQGEAATASLKNAEAIWRSLGDSIELSNNLIDQNFLAIRQGQWQAAMVLLDEAEKLLVEKEAEPFLAGKIAMGFGDVYEAYGQLETSLDYFRQALALYRDVVRDKRAVIDAGNQVGRVQARLGDYEGAKKQIQEVLVTAVEIENNLNIGLCHEDLGRVWLAAGSYEPARIEFLSAIDYLSKSKSPRPLARAQIYLGQTEYLLGDLTRAAAAYEKALPFFEKTPDYTNEAALRFGLSKVALQLGQLDKAEAYLKRSIELTKRLRENAFSKDLRSSFLDSVHDRYETHVELLMARHAMNPDPRLEIEAFEASESGRALALLDSLHDHRRELRRPSDPVLLVEEEKLQKKEQELVDALAQLVSRGTAGEQRAKISKELMEVRSRYETLQARINTSTKFANLLWPDPDYENIKRKITDSDTSLLEYSLGDKNSFAWVVTQDGLKTTKLPDKQTIEKAAIELVHLLQKPPIDASEESQLNAAINEVSRLVLEPLSDKLRTSRLIIVADGALQNVPFQLLKAVPTADEPMVAQFDIVDAPSASALVSVREERVSRNPATKMLVGFGDAVFSSDYSPPNSTRANQTDSSTNRAAENRAARTLPRLFNAKRELRAIGDLAGSESTFYTEYSATRDNLLKVDLSQFRILHVVTHGILNDAEPELSGLYLSLVDSNQKPLAGFVGLADIYKMNAPVDLVVLSACQTALGKKMRGEGVIGLTRGFMYAGAASVVASLWQVDDEVTAELMKHFYTFMLRDGMTPPAALRAAQNQIRSQSKWKSPYFWAGFTIQGDPDLKLKAPAQIASVGLKQLIGGVALGLLLLAVAYRYLRRRRVRTKARALPQK